MPQGALRIGTRRSPLALRQAEIVARLLSTAHPGIRMQLVPISTEGDRRADVPMASLGEGAFVRSLEKGLLAQRIDVAVHSLKDVPGPREGPLNLLEAAFPERADPREALVSRNGETLAALRPGSRVATGSPRRVAQLLALRPDLEAVPIRGNVDTRLGKLRAGQADALLLARAGLLRLGREAEATEILPPDLMTPAPGQGVLVVQCRADDVRARDLVQAIDQPELRAAAQAERAVLHHLGGGCQIPIGAYARVEAGRLLLLAVFASPDGRQLVRLSRDAPLSAAAELGAEVAAALALQARRFSPLAVSARA